MGLLDRIVGCRMFGEGVRLESSSMGWKETTESLGVG